MRLTDSKSPSEFVSDRARNLEWLSPFLLRFSDAGPPLRVARSVRGQAIRNLSNTCRNLVGELDDARRY
jgi:hypothetical protein